MIKTQYPYVDEDSVEHSDLIKTYSDEGYRLYQLQTGMTFKEAVDVFPCRYTYSEIIPQTEKVPEA